MISGLSFRIHHDVWYMSGKAKDKVGWQKGRSSMRKILIWIIERFRRSLFRRYSFRLSLFRWYSFRQSFFSIMCVSAWVSAILLFGDFFSAMRYTIKITLSDLFLILQKNFLIIFWFWEKNFWFLIFWSGHPDPYNPITIRSRKIDLAQIEREHLALPENQIKA